MVLVFYFLLVSMIFAEINLHCFLATNSRIFFISWFLVLAVTPKANDLDPFTGYYHFQ